MDHLRLALVLGTADGEQRVVEINVGNRLWLSTTLHVCGDDTCPIPQGTFLPTTDGLIVADLDTRTGIRYGS